MNNVLTADKITQITNLDYKEALTILKYSEFPKRQIGSNYVVEVDVFLTWAKGKNITVDLDKLKSNIPA